MHFSIINQKSPAIENMIASLILIITISLITIGCNPFLGVYGIKTPKEINEKKIERISKRFDLPPSDVFELETAFYSFLTTQPRT